VTDKGVDLGGDPVRALAEAVRGGRRRALAQAITLVESTKDEHRRSAEALLAELLPDAGRSIRLGISGVPGAGKSTLIEALGRHIIERSHRVAVLAVDPSSPLSGGSLLGDKTRMEMLSRDPRAFIRPTPTGGTLGGVARRTRETMLLCEAAGFDVVLVETVGVGQSEMAVAEMVDMFLLLLTPGAGDELQGLKKGIVEIADLLLVNKADGDLAAAAERAAADYQSALHLLRARQHDWIVPALQCSALTGRGLTELWNVVEDFAARGRQSGRFAARRGDQAVRWLWHEVQEELLTRLRGDPLVETECARLEGKVAAGRILPTAAASSLLKGFLDREYENRLNESKN
jgi:LAO/AO transport system kinase